MSALALSHSLPDNDAALDGATTVVLMTVCVSAGDVDVGNVLSPLYTAVIECCAADRDEVARLACRAPFRVWGEPRLVPPSLNCTVPVGVPVPDCFVTVAVKVTDCPGAEGFCDDETAVVVAGGPFTVWVTVGEVEPEKVLSPP